MSKYNEIFAIRLRQLRKSLGISQTQLAETVGLSTSTISRYEKNRIEDIKLPNVQQIAEALNVNPEWLIGASDDQRRDNNKISTVPVNNGEDGLVSSYRKLNKEGQKQALIQIANLTKISSYINNFEIDESLQAAHYETEGKTSNQVEEETAHDEAIIAEIEKNEK